MHQSHAHKKKWYRVLVSRQMALNMSSGSIETKAHNLGDLWTIENTSKIFIFLH
jgi:hypothetical protein